MITRLTAHGLTFPHGFLGRTGGVSTGLFDSLNVGLGSSDDPALVRENRARALAVVSPDARLVSLRQVHSATAVEAGDWTDDARPEADALVTDRPGLALGVLTADCGPLLFEDRQAGVIAAAHAGWKGALGGVIGATVERMEKLGACRGRIAAAVGPCIGRRSYEVDEAFRARFEAANVENGAFFTDGRAGHALFDLEGYCLFRLAEAGVTRAEGLGVDTKAESARFFSYRRTTLAGEADYGRQLSLISLPR
ncbi:peptidoglycan editing factor PgeF [Sandaracinobacter sp. RS1-74]|uniref:peptidoglycan editing factor PgeF n=1 Tax=Sandaracinobacteroides sayramensis TaxID=2913411 RepID=UPI001EDC1ABC|nr:peptidoglycan editing factor PgeF [Sandaracinobacteroides sayramensis]MCG2839601.1 peptidoglycan editing factor PgeF [Sandaracinobacteroides sayramensis]